MPVGPLSAASEVSSRGAAWSRVLHRAASLARGGLASGDSQRWRHFSGGFVDPTTQSAASIVDIPCRPPARNVDVCAGFRARPCRHSSAPVQPGAGRAARATAQRSARLTRGPARWPAGARLRRCRRVALAAVGHGDVPVHRHRGLDAAVGGAPEAMRSALARHDELLRAAIGGPRRVRVLDRRGRLSRRRSAAPADAVAAAVEAQRAARRSRGRRAWSCGCGWACTPATAEERDGDYFGPTGEPGGPADGGRPRAARSLVSLATAEVVRGRLPAGVVLVDLGEHELRGLARPERVFQLAWPAAWSPTFPPLRTLARSSGNLPARRASFVGRERGAGDGRASCSAARRWSR